MSERVKIDMSNQEAIGVPSNLQSTIKLPHLQHGLILRVLLRNIDKCRQDFGRELAVELMDVGQQHKVGMAVIFSLQTFLLCWR